ncbi:TPA: hypothetical protein H2X12_003725 [Salmonella enterica]|nr:hypothetical protein [Salmonella enterica]EKQ1727775.1 hypothetical protein [Salmonella enterica]HAK8631655.1 hypothetical protein [Salmonella enterica]
MAEHYLLRHLRQVLLHSMWLHLARQHHTLYLLAASNTDSYYTFMELCFDRN